MGPLMLDVSGCELTPQEIEILDHPLVGGLILFSRNYHDQKQLAGLVKHIRSVTRNDIIIATDHEGGRVQRFREGFSRIPAMGKLYPSAKENMALAKANSEQFGWLMAAELLAFDIDISFAPVLDIWGISEVVGDRSFHQQPKVVIELASEFIKGMHRAGMRATGKHFPGHGNVQEDSHVAMPVDKRTEAEIVEHDMFIFNAINQQGLLDAVMPAHVVYPEIDDMPAGFSKVWIQTYLRHKMQFKGVVFSDDLSMEGATKIGDIGERANAAIQAGCDMVLVCNDPEGAVKVIDSMPSDRFNDHPLQSRIPKLAKSTHIDFASLIRSQAYSQAQRTLEQFYAT